MKKGNPAHKDKDELVKMIKALPRVTTRPMFGYQCYSVGGKFFVGFSKKNDMIIIRLSKEMQAKALRDKQLKFKPFSHGAKMGWVELDGNNLDNTRVFEWIKKGYRHAQSPVSKQ